jgi:hypothetical protein
MLTIPSASPAARLRESGSWNTATPTTITTIDPQKAAGEDVEEPVCERGQERERKPALHHSHSMVAGGLELTS